MQLSRRDLIRLGLVGGAATALPIAKFISTVGADPGNAANPVASPPVDAFRVPLPIPPAAVPVRSDATTDFYAITQRAAQVEILPGRRTTIWGYNGITPGPTIHVRRDRAAMVTQINHLGVPTTTHCHGLDVEPQSDGYPLDFAEPGHVWEHHYPNIQAAATMWYHDHAFGDTGRNVYMGLAGFYLLTDDHEQSLPLPRGEFDIPIVIQDRLFTADGALVYPKHDPQRPVRQGVFGDVLLVNGAPMPFLKVARRKYRFRILNGSNARAYQLALSTGDPMTVISTDGGLMERPAEIPDLFIMPAERYNVVIDFARYPVGTQVVLRNTFAPDPFGDPVPPERTNQVMRFDVVADATDNSSVPVDLAPGRDLRVEDAVRTRRWVFDRAGGNWVINGLRFDEHRFDARPAFGTTEIWEFVNKSAGWIHPIHPHLVEFLILDRNGRPPEPHERGPKDVTFLGPNHTVRVLMRFVHFRGRYVMHCHNLEHEDHDMMTQFEVV